jgi:drug/metabolite transporter (DMT)-like permease
MLLIVAIRIVLSVSANAIQKRLLLDGNRVGQIWILTYGLMLLPAAVAAGVMGPANLSVAFWRDILLGGGLDAVGNLAMVAALRGTDISLFGPLNAFRPVLALAAGWIFLGELPTLAGLLGTGITVGGAMVLFGGSEGGLKRHAPWRMIFLRTAGLSLGAIGAVFLKRAAMGSTAAMTVAAWILCGLVCLLVVAIARARDSLRALPKTLEKHRVWIPIHAAVFISMQWLTIRIFQTTLLAYAFVFFQLAMVLQVIVGRVFFKEASFARRMVGAVIMSVGSGIIIWKG